jgi:hypothetical protein
MNWTIFGKSARLVTRHVSSLKIRCRPNLEALETRTVLSPVDFLEVQSQSILSLSGTIGGVDFQQQGTGSLTTTYFGDFHADVDLGNGTIRFIGAGNDFCAANTGSWAPLADGGSGTATAIYGLQADIGGTAWLAAIRDFHLRADGTPLALYPNADGSFGFASTEPITINAGSGTYSPPSMGHSQLNLGGLGAQDQAGDGTLVDNGSTLRVTVPIDITVNTTIGGLPATLHIQGAIVGSATAPAQSLAITTFPSTITAGTPFTITVTALDGFGQTATGYTGTVHFTASNGATADYTFTPADRGQHAFTGLVIGRAGNYTVAGADTANPLITGSAAFTITPAAADHIAFAVPSITAGSPFTITVTVQDAYGNTVTGYTGTVHFTLTGPAMAQADYIFTADDMGQHAFNSLVLSQPGDYTLTATDQADPTIRGSTFFTVGG